MADLDPGDVTRLLHAWKGGDGESFDRLIAIVYPELRRLAARQLAREWRRDGLQTTAVVNDAYVKLLGQRDVHWHDRGHFFAVAAHLMRRILVDHARRRLRYKRGGGTIIAPADVSTAPAPTPPLDRVDLLDLDRALQKLEHLDPGAAKIIELRFFAGLTIEETAAALGISITTVKREWAIVKGWLHGQLTHPPPRSVPSP